MKNRIILSTALATSLIILFAFSSRPEIATIDESGVQVITGNHPDYPNQPLYRRYNWFLVNRKDKYIRTEYEEYIIIDGKELITAPAKKYITSKMKFEGWAAFKPNVGSTDSTALNLEQVFSGAINNAMKNFPANVPDDFLVPDIE